MKTNFALKMVIMLLCLAMLLSSCKTADPTSTPSATTEQETKEPTTTKDPETTEAVQTITPNNTATPAPSTTPTPTPTPPSPPVDPDEEYKQFGTKILGASLYNDNFEIWPENGNNEYCPRAFFQCCVVINKSIIDMTDKMGTDGYEYKFVFRYRVEGVKDFSIPFTVPTETHYAGGNGSVIYRFQVSNCPEGDMVANWTDGTTYEIVVQVLKNNNVVGYFNLFTTWNESYNTAHDMYTTFWKRHDRSKGYRAGDQELTDIDISDPTGDKDLPTPPADDDLDRTNAKEITSQGDGYSTILREKSTGEILFSPNIDNLRDILSNTSPGQIIDKYLGRLTITVEDHNGDDFYTYAPIILPVYESKAEWFDFFLQGDGIDCGFCPLAGRTYDIYLEILSSDGKKVLFYGDYSDITAPESFAENKYYNAIPVPGEENLKYTITYAVKNSTGGTITGLTQQSLKYGEMTTPVTAVPQSGYVFINWSDGSTNPERAPEKVVRNKTVYAIFVKEDADGAVADMYITTDSGNPITSRSSYVNGTIKIISKNKDLALDTMKIQIRGRGNSSFNGGASQSSYDSKNSYRLKLETKTKLLGLGDEGNRDWVLNSNKFDASGLRNYSVWTLAEKMGTLPFNIECSWVNLYVNGVYRGMYMVTELIEAANGRVEVEDNINTTDKGFLLEFDFRGDQESGLLGIDYFYVDGYAEDGSNPVEFVVKSNTDGDADTKAIQDYIEKCHKAIMSGKRSEIDKYIDIPSLIDMFIIEEFSKDVDVGVASFFVQKNPGEKLFFTAPWDFDFGFGTYGPAVSYKGFYSEADSRCTWFKALIGQTWFRFEVEARLKQLTPMFEETCTEIRNKAEEIYIAADRNCTLWNLYGNHFHSYVSSNVSSNLYSYDEHIDYLIDWMESRWQWMLDNI